MSQQMSAILVILTLSASLFVCSQQQETLETNENAAQIKYAPLDPGHIIQSYVPFVTDIPNNRKKQ